MELRQLESSVAVRSLHHRNVLGMRTFLFGVIGSLEVGKKADIAILDRDLYAIPIDEVKNLKCLMTLFDGEVVYSSPDSSLMTPAH